MARTAMIERNSNTSPSNHKLILLSCQASPKLGIFFCLACSGIHRSLGVHISFVRSVTMDAFKLAEVRRMSLGGNAPYKAFFDDHPSNKMIARDFESCTISERYDSEAGEEWKERLTCKVEEREYVPGATKKDPPAKKAAVGEIPTPTSGRNTPQGFGPESQKSKNEAYFATKGAENANRSADLAPSQGGKYAGFGSSPAPSSNNNDDMSSPPAIDDFQKDPVAALTKGFGWLGSSFAKQAAVVNKTYIQPGISNLNTTDFAAQAKQLGNNLGTGLQQTSRGLNKQINNFIDPEHQQASSGSSSGGGPRTSGTRAGAAPEKKDFWDSFGADPAGPPKEKKDFWDDFAAAGEAKTQQTPQKPMNVGTSAMKGSSSSKKKDEDGGWGDW
jgi:ADP-ribosylation factor GTPase-activating protein 1